MSEYSYVGKGKIHARKRGTTDPLRYLGNASALTLGVEESKIDLLNFATAGGGKDDSISRIQAMTAQMTLHNLSPENMALVLRGASSATATGAVVDEPQAATLDGLVRLDHVPDPDVALVVKNTAGTTTYVEGTDYTRSRAGFTPLSTGAITAAQDLEISYTRLASSTVQVLTNSADEFELFFEGLNEAKSGRPFLVTLHKVKFSPLSNLGLIADEFAGAEITGEVLLDDNISGAGISQYAKIQMATA